MLTSSDLSLSVFYPVQPVLTPALCLPGPLVRPLTTIQPHPPIPVIWLLLSSLVLSQGASKDRDYLSLLTIYSDLEIKTKTLHSRYTKISLASKVQEEMNG